MKPAIILRKLMLLLAMLSAWPALSAFVVDGITYRIKSASEAQASGISQDFKGDVTIPKEVVYDSKTYSVTSIGSSAFKGCSGLTSIKIPSSVTSIGDEAFQGCYQLTSLIFEDGNKGLSLGSSVFFYCQLVTVYLGRNIVTESPFAGQRKLISLTIGNSVTSIGSNAFANCSGLTSIKISGNVTSIGSRAFDNCSRLTSIKIPGSVISIGDEAFYDCSGLTSLIFEDGKKDLSLGDDVFYNCPIETGHLGRNICDSNLFSGKKSLTSLTIGDSVTSIRDYAFQACSGLTSIKIPESVTSIGDLAFYDCSGLTSIEIPESVTSIGDEAFRACSGLTSIKIPESVTSIGDLAFYDCSGLTSLILEDGEKGLSLGSYVFKNCPIATGHLGRNIETESPFSRKESLTSLTIGNSVTSIGASAFFDCSGVTSIEIPESITSIGASAFCGCSGLTSLNIPGSVTSIGHNAFTGCSRLTSIKIPESVTSIGSGTFSDCSQLTSVEIPGSVTDIGAIAFLRCSGLISINIPGSVTSIGNYAFSGCSGLISIKIPGSVTSIDKEAFQDCYQLTSLIFEDGEQDLSLGYHVFYNCPLRTIYLGRNLIGHSSPFNRNSYLRTLTIGNSVTSIGDYTFEGCTNIKKIRSLNPTPPVITSMVFDSVDKKTCQLVVTKGNLGYYLRAPVWKEFLNMNDNMLALNPLPAMRYGDEPVDLSAYAPEGVTLSYESSDNSVARLDGSTLSIVGAGEATIGASYPEAGTPMEIIGQMRQLIIDKADLDVALEQEVYEIMQGEAFPAFGLTCSGLCYDDSASDIDELPSIVCEAENTATPGEYAINLEGGNDRNYNFHTKAARLIIHESSGVENVSSDNDVRCYGLNGRLTVEGAPVNAIVNIYRFDGSLCHSAKSDGTAMTFEVANNGFYIVIVNGKPYRLKI